MELNSLVKVRDNLGRVRYIGQTKFAPGDWIGIELSSPNGKNNGQVGGVKYFECQPLHGIFVRPQAVTLVENKHEVQVPESSRIDSKETGPTQTGKLSTESDSVVDQLKKRLRIMENKRLLDKDQIEKLQMENRQVTKLNNVVKKLQVKLQSTSEELHFLRTKLGQREETAAISYKEEDVEKLLMDREVAEAKVEALNNQVDDLSAQIEQLQMQCTTLQRENDIYANSTSNDRDRSTAHNGVLRVQINRLEEALIKLKSDNEMQVAEISRLRNELRVAESVLVDFEKVKASFARAQDTIAELRLQLDSSMGSEAVIEELTERNLDLTERNQQLNVAVEELRLLKELSDELEESHNLRERELQDEVADLASKYTEQSEDVRDIVQRKTYLESAVMSLRETIAQLHNEIEIAKRNSTAQTEYMSPTNQSQEFVVVTSPNTSSVSVELLKEQLAVAHKQLEIMQNYMSVNQYPKHESALRAVISSEKICVYLRILWKYYRDILPENPLVCGRICMFCAAARCLAQSFLYNVQHASLQDFADYGQFKDTLEVVEMSLYRSTEDLMLGTLDQQRCIKALELILSQLGAMRICINAVAIFEALVDTVEATKTTAEDSSSSHLLAPITAMFTQLQSKSKSEKIICNDATLEVFSKAIHSLGSGNIPDDLHHFGKLQLTDFTFEELTIAPWDANKQQNKVEDDAYENMIKETVSLRNETQLLKQQIAVRDRKIEDLEVQIHVAKAKMGRAQEREDQFEDLQSSILNLKQDGQALRAQIDTLKAQSKAQEALIVQYKKSGSQWSSEKNVYSSKQMTVLFLESEVKLLQRSLDHVSSRKQLPEYEPLTELSGTFNRPIGSLLYSHGKYFDLVRSECQRQDLVTFQNPRNAPTLWRKWNDTPALRAKKNQHQLTKIESLLW